MTAPTNAEQLIRRFLPAESMKGTAWNLLLGAIGDSEQLNWTQARLAEEQLFDAKAGGEYLNRRAAWSGLKRPDGVGLSDEAFRKLLIGLNTGSAVPEGFWGVLEVFFGFEATHAGVTAGITATTVSITDGSWVILQFDKNHTVTVTLNNSDFTDPAAATLLELAEAFNKAFRREQVAAASIVVRDRLKIFTLTPGLEGSVAVMGGTLQPVLELPTVLNTAMTPPLTGDTWTITVSSAIRTARYAYSGSSDWFNSIAAGDHVVINDRGFSAGNQGSFEVTAVGFAGSYWFEVLNPVAVAEVATQGSDTGVVFCRARTATIYDNDRAAFLNLARRDRVTVELPATTEVVDRDANEATYLVDPTAFGITSATLDAQQRFMTIRTTNPSGVVQGRQVILSGLSLNTDFSPIYVAGREDGHSSVSSSGTQWIEGGAIGDKIVRGIAHNPDGIFVACGSDGLVATSPDGQTWTVRNSGGADTYEAVAYGNGRFIVVGNSRYIIVSDDNGETWTPKDLGAGLFAVDIAYENPHWLAVGDDKVMSSINNGEVWTPTASPFAPEINLTSVVALPEGWVIGAEQGLLASSNVLLNWIVRNSQCSESIVAIARGREGLVAVANGGQLATSPDGETWTARSPGVPLNEAAAGVAYVSQGETWVAAYNEHICTSTDNGATWVATEPPGAASKWIFSIDGRPTVLKNIGGTLNGLFRVTQVPTPDTFVVAVPNTAEVVPPSVSVGVAVAAEARAELVAGPTHLYPGAFVCHPDSSLRITGHVTATNEIVEAGGRLHILEVQDATQVPDEAGLLVLGYGYEYQTGPVRYLGRASGTQLILDSSFVFPLEIPSGATVNLLQSTAEPLSTNAGALYATGSAAGRAAAVDMLRKLVPAGVDLTVSVKYPGDTGLAGSGLPTRGDQRLSDIVSIYAGDDVDSDLAAAREEEN